MRDAILTAARASGFHRVAIVPIEPARRHAEYEAWLAAGHAGEMTFLASPTHVEPRRAPANLLPGARTLVVVALAYDRTDPPIAPSADGLVTLRGRIARYARGDDYHFVLREKLFAVARAVSGVIGRKVVARPCIDSAPVLEREWAERGGLGFIAKNTMLIAPGLGSYVLLGEMLLDVDAEPTAPLAPPRSRCGSCRSCLDACPTGAFTDAFVLDARRCISYLTIEFQGVIPRELRAPIGTWIVGCDICQEVCPYNHGSGEPPSPELARRSVDHALPDLLAMARRGTNGMRHFVKRTAMRRISLPQMLRNVAVALGNLGDPRALPALLELLGHRGPMVRLHAGWAAATIAARHPDTAGRVAAALRAQLACEADAEVVADLAQSLASLAAG